MANAFCRSTGVADCWNPSIALFTDCYDQINGVARTYRALVGYCARKGRRLEVVTPGTESETEDLGSVRIHRVAARLPMRYYSDLSFDLRIPDRRIAAKFKGRLPDLVQLATPGSVGINGLRFALKRSIPMIGAYHTALPEYAEVRTVEALRRFGIPAGWAGNTVRKAAWKVLGSFYGRCSMLLAPTNAVKEQLEQRFGLPVGIFSRGVDTARFRPGSPKTGPPTAIYVGRIAAEKNLDWLAKTFNPDSAVRLLVVGDGPGRQPLQSTGIKAEFTGFLTGEDLSEAYRRADFFVFPSFTDTFGNVVLEAMASGLPVIVTDRMGPKELVDPGVNGFVAGSQKEFARYVETLAGNRELCLRMGASAREAALERRWEKVFDRLFGFYEQVIVKARLTVARKAQDGGMEERWIPA